MDFKLVICVLFVFICASPSKLQVLDADCLTADGNAGRCTDPSECMPSYRQLRPVMCRYSGGFGTRICCPRSSFRTHSSYTTLDERRDSYNNDDPIAFPGEAAYSEFSPYNQQTTNNYNPSYSENSNYRPYDTRPTYNKPQYHEKPSYGSESSSNGYQERPTYSSGYNGYQERPNYSSGSHEYQERPSYSSGSHEYQERPSYSSGSDVYQERPSYSTGSNGYQERPSYSSGSHEYQERPSYSTGSNGYQERPSYSSGSNGYQERPTYSSGSGGYEERPNYSSTSSNGNQGRPSYSTGSNGNQGRPSYSTGSNEYQGRPNYSSGSQERPRSRPESGIGSRETTTSWEYPTSGKRTTPQPSWAVEDSSSGINSNFKKRISELKCEEFSRPVTQTLNVLPLSIDSEAVPLKLQNCDFSAVKLIVGGEASELGEFPHMAAVGYKTRASRNILWNCGGTLISERFVLTAGHCANTTYGNPVVVRLGEYNIERDNDGAEPEDYTVEQVIVHPSYFKSLKYNDIALIRLARNVQFNKFIRPACLSTDDNIRVKPVATGWGRTDFVGKQSEILLKVSLSVIDNRQCNSYYNTNNPGSASFSSGIVDTMLCAGEVEGGRDTCLGDSGGPLTITKKENPCVHYVIGITSFGKICGAPKSPGVYTKVSKYLSWIEKTVWS